MVHWSDYFWGDGNRGLEILSSNVKNGAIAIEEFQRFLNESIQCESAYCKNLSRLQSQLHKAQYLGTFTPIWFLIRDLFDKVSSAHLASVNFYQELLRDIHNYQDLHQKKIKAHIQKDGDITRTFDLITQLNNAIHVVNKAKEQYHSITSDYERAKRNSNNPANNSSSTVSQDNNSTSIAQAAMNSIAAKQLERLEKKSRLAQDDYKSTIDKYNAVRNDYEKRFHDACTKFQDFEIDHIEKMLAFSLNYSEILQRDHEQVTVARNEFNEKLKSFTGNDILDVFVEQKKTGTDRPVTLQLEELDNVKASTPSIASNVSDLTNSYEDSNVLDQLESGVPSFQAHFTVPVPGSKNIDNNRAFSPHSAVNNPHSSPHNSIMSPTSNITNSSVNATTSNNPMLRSHESNSSNDQVTNPFDVKIRKPKFPGFFGTNRRDKKVKKDDKKSSAHAKPNKASHVHRSRDESNGVNMASFNDESDEFSTKMDNMDGFTLTANSHVQAKRTTPEPYITSNPSVLTNELNRQGSHSAVTSRSSKISSSDDSSDEDDSDNPVLKIEFKINPKAEVASEVDDETKIVNAMRLIDKNIGNLLTTGRGSPNRTQDISKSLSNEQMATRILPPPPPIPSRAITTIPNNVTTETIDQSSMFPPHEEFDRPSTSLSCMTAANQENISTLTLSIVENNNSTPISFIDDDTEATDSFPHNNLTNKTTELQISDTSSTNQSNQTTWPLFNSSITSFQTQSSISQSISNEQPVSPSSGDSKDQIPLAIAFQEVFHAMMSGNNQENWKSRIVGELLISFPASVLTLLDDPLYLANKLQFRLKNLDHVENISIQSSSIIQNDSSDESGQSEYKFDMMELSNTLRSLHEAKPSSRFFNLNALTYEVKHSDQSCTPIQISSKWTRTLDTISMNINYFFNSIILPDSIHLNNNSVIFYTIITDGQELKESSPTAGWSPSECKLWWKVPYISNGTGSLSATLVITQMNTTETNGDQQQEQPLTSSSSINAYFLGENALFSSIDFDLACHGYRISLLKKKILSGKYQSEPDQTESLHLFQHPTILPASTA